MTRFNILLTVVCAVVLCFDTFSSAQIKPETNTSPWIPDNGDGTYKNPIIFADYSDPDVIRVKDDFYLVSSSFVNTPGLPVLHSKDLVNWTIIGHALRKLPEIYNNPIHGSGVWAPSIRYHNGEFYIYYGNPDLGIFMVKAKDLRGNWDEPVLVQEGKGLEDPCPFWDANGAAYLVHAFAGSRAGIKSILLLNRMSKAGTKIIDEGNIIYDGHGIDPTIEGPKLYKRNGYYYIFAPAGGVKNGWQTVLRSKNIYGPYERRVVLEQGQSDINGPHQGAWVTTQTGESWFIHFRDMGAYGRVTYLEPMKWENDWPIIGKDSGSGKGEPVVSFKKPNVGKTYPKEEPQTTDEFNSTSLGLQWQWAANFRSNWAYTSSGTGFLRLYCVPLPDNFKNYWNVPNILSQKFPGEEFTATAKINFHSLKEGEKTGFIVMGASYAYLSLVSRADGLYLTYNVCNKADKGHEEIENIIGKAENPTVYFRAKVTKGAVCRFSYSYDGKSFTYAGKDFTAEPGRWVGAVMGLFSSSKEKTNDAGYADIDWFRVKK